MSYRDSYSLYGRDYFSTPKEYGLSLHSRPTTSYSSTPSSVLSSLSSFRSRPYTGVGVTYTPAPDVNEVYPGLFVGDAVAAKDKAFLRRMGINYVLNTAEGKRYTQVDTDHIYYRDCPGLRYKGFQLMDLPTTDISKYFHIAANFIDEGISRGGRVLVHCMMGVSRSATCAIAFLMIKRGMTLTEALALVRSRRDIHPNDGFIRQLQDLDRELRVCRVR
ncbi:dual specificity protein phosphatase 13B-like isoform X1 [Danaus plexippus]|uniref:dual specificity protein phosphatase 13B-like isoform X1 n=1 Tax=Danaus plexippus TaxID=13037 RepID=UPI002AB1A09C|nr:dual specificity protein phosphatase 13B-like isoform X1 [Danaus plexippus]